MESLSLSFYQWDEFKGSIKVLTIAKNWTDDQLCQNVHETFSIGFKFNIHEKIQINMQKIGQDICKCQAFNEFFSQ